jgi:hypothetical protein
VQKIPNRCGLGLDTVSTGIMLSLKSTANHLRNCITHILEVMGSAVKLVRSSTIEFGAISWEAAAVSCLPCKEGFYVPQYWSTWNARQLARQPHVLIGESFQYLRSYDEMARLLP